MGRKKAEFKNLGTLPKGEWRMISAKASGAIILTSPDHEPMCLYEGKLTTLNESMKGKTDGQEES